uniref:RING-CH-type domain-containing protein n=1 Tax=Angiostrongylus cantonensis TaxID=6313 RepID=A0A0K0D738_ANGCA
LCRICHTECESTRDPFVSPCRCSGSLLHVHRSCLVHWLELSTRKMIPSPRCELCGYNYRRRNCVNVKFVVHVSVCIHIHLCVLLCVLSGCMCRYLSMCIVYVCLCVYVRMYLCIYVCMY